MFESSGSVELKDANGKAHQVGENTSFPTARNRQFVVYWYEAHGRSVANEYLAKVYLVADAMKDSIVPMALVQVITPIDSGEREQAWHGVGLRHLLLQVSRLCSLGLFRVSAISKGTRKKATFSIEIRLRLCKRQSAGMENGEKLLQCGAIQYRRRVETIDPPRLCLCCGAFRCGRTVGRGATADPNVRKQKVSGERETVQRTW